MKKLYIKQINNICIQDKMVSINKIPVLPISPIIRPIQDETETYSIYNLTLSNAARKEFKHQSYSMDAVFQMIISAKNEDEARVIAFQKNSKINAASDTHYFWSPYEDSEHDLTKQKKYIDCEKIGTSMFAKSEIICTSEQHDTG